VNCYLLRYAEIGLKSNQTRKRWLEILRKNIQRGLFWIGAGYDRVVIVQGRLLLYSDDKRVEDVLAHTFGLVSYSPAEEFDADIEEIKSRAIELYKQEDPSTFRVTTQRVTKNFEMTSIEINYCVGEAVYECGGKVDLTGYDLNIGIEIINERAYIFSESFKCPGGLPLGVQGGGCAIIRDYRDFVSALLFMKRGCNADLIVVRSSMCSNYIDILQGYAFMGLRILLVDEEWELGAAMAVFSKEGTEIFVSGVLLKECPGTNLCPCELYSEDHLERSINGCNLNVIPMPARDFKISAGCVIYYNDTVLLLRRKEEKTWAFPKGGVDNMEFFRQAAIREACEESGSCSLEILEYVGKSHYSARDKEGPFTKDVYYYLCETKRNDVSLEYLFDSYTFLPQPEAKELLSFENDKIIIEEAERIRKHIKRNVKQ